MVFVPTFTITACLLGLTEQIAALRERIQNAAVELSWIPALQRIRALVTSTRQRLSRAIRSRWNKYGLSRKDGTLEAAGNRSQREVLTISPAFDTSKRRGSQNDQARKRFLAPPHSAKGVMIKATLAGTAQLQCEWAIISRPTASDVSGLMMELLEWWNKPAKEVSPVLSSANIASPLRVDPSVCRR